MLEILKTAGSAADRPAVCGWDVISSNLANAEATQARRRGGPLQA